MSSCENENQEVLVKSASNLLSEAEIKDIGVKHNEALASVLKELQKYPDLNKEQKSMKAVMATEKYLRTIYPDDDQIIAAAKEEEYTVSKNFTKLKVKSAGSLIVLALDENYNHFSEKQRKLLKECDNILGTGGLSLQEIIEGLKRIQLKAKDLPVEEQSLILSATEVGKQSAIYWSENLDAWDAALNGTETKRTKGWFSFGAVVKADVGGAVGGAVTAAVLNALPGPGTVAYGGAILGGAAGASTCSAVVQILDYCFYPGIGSHISYFTKDPMFLRSVIVKDFSKIKPVGDIVVDFKKVELYVDEYHSIPRLLSLKEVELFAYEKSAYSNSHFINVPLENFEDKSCTIIRHLVGITSPDNVLFYPEELDDPDREDSNDIIIIPSN